MGLGGQRHTPAALIPRKRRGTHRILGWVGPRASMDGCGKSRPPPGSDPGPSSPQRVDIPTELPGPLLNIIQLLIFHTYFVQLLSIMGSHTV